MYRRGVEILLIKKDTGEIKARVRESFNLYDNGFVEPTETSRFEAFGRGIQRVFRNHPDCVFQFSFTDLDNVEQQELFVPVSTKVAKLYKPLGKNVYSPKMD